MATPASVLPWELHQEQSANGPNSQEKGRKEKEKVKQEE